MKHPLIGALALIAAASVAVMARDADSKADRSAEASIVLADIAAAPIAAVTVSKANAAEVEPGSNVIGGSSATSMMVSEAQKEAIRRQFSLLGDGPARLSLRGLAIGAKLPREKVRISRLPPEIAKIVPKYGAYEYFLTESGSIVIVDPGAYQVVDIIGA